MVGVGAYIYDQQSSQQFCGEQQHMHTTKILSLLKNPPIILQEREKGGVLRLRHERQN